MRAAPTGDAATLDVHTDVALGQQPRSRGQARPRTAFRPQPQRGIGGPLHTRTAQRYQHRATLARPRDQPPGLAGARVPGHLGEDEAHPVEQCGDRRGPAGGGDPPDHGEALEGNPGLERGSRSQVPRPPPAGRRLETHGAGPLPHGRCRGGERECDGGRAGTRLTVHRHHRTALQRRAGEQPAQGSRHREHPLAGQDDGAGELRGPVQDRERLGVTPGQRSAG